MQLSDDRYREHRVPNDANNTAIPNERRSSTTAEHVLDIDIEDDKPPLQLRFTADCEWSGSRDLSYHVN